MHVLDHLHVIAGNNRANIAQRLHLSAFISRNSGGVGSELSGGFQAEKHIRGIAAPADRERHVPLAHKIFQLLGKYEFITRIVCPCRQQWNIVRQGQNSKPVRLAVRNRSFIHVAHHVRR